MQNKWERIAINLDPAIDSWPQAFGFMPEATEEELEVWKGKKSKEIQPFLQLALEDKDGSYDPRRLLKDIISLSQSREEELSLFMIGLQKINELLEIKARDVDGQAGQMLERLRQMFGKETTDPDIDDCNCPSCEKRREFYGIKRGDPMDMEKKQEWIEITHKMAGKPSKDIAQA